MLRLDIPGVDLIHRAYELYPEPAQLAGPVVEGETWERLVFLAAALDLPLRPVEFGARTRKAHEASFFARTRGRERQLRHEIFTAYWSDQRDIGRIDVLTELASRAGMDAEDLRIALDIDQFEADVRHDQEVAQRLRVPGTPTIFIGSGPRAQVVIGARSRSELQGLIENVLRFGEHDSTDV